MNTLCFASNLTSAELAAWVQAIGSIVAIFGAVWVAVWQAGKQNKYALERQATEQLKARTELAKTLSVVAQNVTKVVAVVASQMGDRNAVYSIAEGDSRCDIEEIVRLDSAIAGIPIHNLPSTLVSPRMSLESTVRQFREKVEMVLRVHRSMNADAFGDFFRTNREMYDSLKATCDDIAREIERMQDTAVATD